MIVLTTDKFCWSLSTVFTTGKMPNSSSEQLSLTNKGNTLQYCIQNVSNYRGMNEKRYNNKLSGNG